MISIGFIIAVNCLMTSLNVDDSQPASAEAAVLSSELDEIITDLGAEESLDRGFARLSGIIRQVAPNSDEKWKVIAARCCVLAEEPDEYPNAIYVLPLISSCFPEVAGDCLTSLLQGIDRTDNVRTKIKIIDAIGRVPLKSANAVTRLRRELDEKASFGSFISIHAAQSIAAVTPDTDERNELLEWLESHLHNKLKHVRWISADALGEFGGDSAFALESLQDLFNDNVPTVRAAAARAVWKISKKDSRVTDTLIGVLRDDESSYHSAPVSTSTWSPSSHDLAMWSLGQIQIASPQVLEALAAQLKPRDFHHRRLAISTLLQLPIKNEDVSVEVKDRIVDATRSEPDTRNNPMANRLPWGKLRDDAIILLNRIGSNQK